MAIEQWIRKNPAVRYANENGRNKFAEANWLEPEALADVLLSNRLAPQALRSKPFIPELALRDPVPCPTPPRQPRLKIKLNCFQR